MSLDDHFVGLTIDHLLEIHGYLQIYFTNGDIMNLFSSYTCEPDDLSKFQADEIIKYSEDEKEMHFYTSSGYSIRMSMLEADWNGPEAASLRPQTPNSPIIVWF